MLDSISDEFELLRSVKMELYNQKKMTNEELDKLDKLIFSRYEKLREYSTNKHDAKQAALDKETDRVLKLIDENAENARVE